MCGLAHCLNPRFDGAFLNFKVKKKHLTGEIGLNPRFDGAFLNSKDKAQWRAKRPS